MGYQFQMPPTVPLGSLNTGLNTSSTASNINSLASTQPNTTLPSWLNTDPNSIMAELHRQYGAIPGLMGTAGITSAYDSAKGTNMGMGLQTANNAAAEETARAGIDGGQVNSEMVKSQSMLPVYQTNSKLSTDEATQVATQRQAQAQMMNQVAAQMASLRSSYLSNLGQLQLAKQGQSNTWVNSQMQLHMAQEAQDRQYSLSANSLASRDPTPAATAPFTGQVTRAPNNMGIGGMQYTPQFMQYLSQSGQGGKLPTNPMAYPQTTGMTGGSDMDEYNTWMRNMIAVAQPSVAPYNVQPQDAQNKVGASGFQWPDSMAA